jgi:hypothetical protein
MTIIADRHYKGAATETVIFSEKPGSRVHVGSVATAGGALPGLPTSVPGSQTPHRFVVVTVGFTGPSGGSVDIDVAGSLGGNDTSRIRQIDGVGFRTATFVVD